MSDSFTLQGKRQTLDKEADSEWREQYEDFVVNDQVQALACLEAMKMEGISNLMRKHWGDQTTIQAESVRSVLLAFQAHIMAHDGILYIGRHRLLKMCEDAPCPNFDVFFRRVTVVAEHMEQAGIDVQKMIATFTLVWP